MVLPLSADIDCRFSFRVEVLSDFPHSQWHVNWWGSMKVLFRQPCCWNFMGTVGARRKGGNYVNLLLMYEILKGYIKKTAPILEETRNWVAIYLAYASLWPLIHKIPPLSPETAPPHSDDSGLFSTFPQLMLLCQLKTDTVTHSPYPTCAAQHSFLLRVITG